ncbi:ribonuclease H-like domain-containing protein [Patescibacteria group bacterium]|nr:ribonuclease H-like domain-containing protein [Patescibacteria group bacterium]
MYKLYLDIETIPAGEEHHGNLKMLHAKKEAKKEKGGEDFEQYLLKTSFDGSFGRIICIGYAIDNNPTECLCEENEAEMLRKFWELARDADLFIGHNILDFDLRFIYQRSIVNKVLPSADLNFARYRNYPIYDTMREWVKWSMNSVGLEHLALALGIPSPKDGIDGSQVFDFYQKGKIKEIAEYCQRDVETTRAVYKRMIFRD